MFRCASDRLPVYSQHVQRRRCKATPGGNKVSVVTVLGQVTADLAGATSPEGAVAAACAGHQKTSETEVVTCVCHAAGASVLWGMRRLVIEVHIRPRHLWQHLQLELQRLAYVVSFFEPHVFRQYDVDFRNEC